MRSLQFIAKFIPIIRNEFCEKLSQEKQNTLRYFDQVLKDYNNHIEEINNKLLSVMDTHLISALSEVIYKL